MGELLEAFRGSLHQLADINLHGDVRPKVGASDLVQQTLLEATQGFAGFRGESREQLTAWIARILVRNLLNELRKWRSTKMRSVNREVNLDRPGAPILVGEDKTPSSLVMAREREALLREALKRLTPDQQQVIRLRHSEQLGFQEIARQMQREYSAVRMLWYRAIEKLMREMGGGYESTGVTLSTPGFGRYDGFATEVGLLVLLCIWIVGVLTKRFRRKPPPNPFPSYTGLVYVAVTESRVVFLAMKDKLFTWTLGEPLAEHPHSENATLEFNGRWRGKVLIELDDALTYNLDRMDSIEAVQRVKSALEGRRVSMSEK